MQKQRYFHAGLAVFLTACAILVFYDTFFLSRTLLHFLDKTLDIVAPVIYGAAMAYLLAPVVDFFDRLVDRRRVMHSSRRRFFLVRAASLLLTWLVVGIFFYALVMLLLPSLTDSILQLAANIETYYTVVYSWAERLFADNPDYARIAVDILGDYFSDFSTQIKNLLPQAQQALAILTGGIWSVVVFAKNIFIGIVVSVYLLASKEQRANAVRRALYGAVSDVRYKQILRGVNETDRIFSGFVRGKLLDSLIIGILCLICTTILGFPYAPLISVVVGVTNVIPVFGPFLGAIPSALLILLVDPVKCLYFIAFILILQQVDGNIIGPKILGGSTGLSGFAVVVAIVVGGGFGGALGMFLGVPVFACISSAVRTWVNWRLAKKGAPADAAAYSSKTGDVAAPAGGKEVHLSSAPDARE
ncbi:MAG: AI-2E family transporter [Oscillospiraceae bacterium]|nr:AI-2E family transporter [Oscillospiraceae bacterium]